MLIILVLDLIVRHTMSSYREKKTRDTQDAGGRPSFQIVTDSFANMQKQV